MYTQDQIQYIKRKQELVLKDIDLLGTEHGQVKEYIQSLLKTTRWDKNNDVRINILNQIEKVLNPHLMN